MRIQDLSAYIIADLVDREGPLKQTKVHKFICSLCICENGVIISLLETSFH